MCTESGKFKESFQTSVLHECEESVVQLNSFGEGLASQGPLCSFKKEKPNVCAFWKFGSVQKFETRLEKACRTTQKILTKKTILMLEAQSETIET